MFTIFNVNNNYSIDQIIIKFASGCEDILSIDIISKFVWPKNK